MSAASQVRSWRADALRGLAMLCVVLGHAIQRNVSPSSTPFLVVAAFEMPLFAFVSGYVARPPSSARWRWVAARARRLIVPFLTWLPILWFMSRFAFTGLDIVGIPASLPTYALQVLTQPAYGLWYLLVLFEWCVVLALASCLPVRRFALLLAAAACAVAVALALRAVGAFLWPGDYGYGHFAALAPFFAAGLAVQVSNGNLDRDQPRSYTLAALLLFAALAFSVAAPAVRPGPLGDAAIFARRIAGVCAAVFLIRGLPRGPVQSALAYVGRSSLGIYAIHLLFLRTGVGTGWLKALTSCVVAVGFSLVLTQGLRRNRILAWLLLGERNPEWPRAQGGPTASPKTTAPTDPSRSPGCR